ncbi:MAG: ATP-binding protein [Actinomycetota bacterium]
MPGDLKFRSSILLEILAALGIVLLVSVVTSSLLQATLTGAALERQAHEVAAGRLSLLVEGYRNRERELEVDLRAIAENLEANGLLQPARRSQLIAELGRSATSLELDLLQLLQDGQPSVSASSRTIDSAQVPALDRSEESGRSTLVQTVGEERTFVQARAVPIGRTTFVLVGGYDFYDAFAFSMRERIVGGGQVILVAGGMVVGSTTSGGTRQIPGSPEEGTLLPLAPTPVSFGGETVLVAYVSTGDSPVPTTDAAMGVVLTDPVAALNRQLERGRLSSSLFLAVVALGLGWILVRRIIRPLVSLSATAEQIAGGDLQAGFSAPRMDEIGRLAGSLQRMTLEMQAKTRNLQEASKRLVGAQEQERRRVARDLHDGMQQQLVSLAVKLRRASSVNGQSSELGALADDAEDAAFALQELGRGISPTVLADQGLNAALRAAAGRLPMHVVLNVQPDLEDARFSPGIEGTYYYVALEAMNNAQKHAPSSTLTVQLAQEAGAVVLSVLDDGPGFHLEHALRSGGSGLQNMRDRMSAEGGTIELTSAPGSGTQVVCRVPRLSGGGTLLKVDDNRGNSAVKIGLL